MKILVARLHENHTNNRWGSSKVSDIEESNEGAVHELGTTDLSMGVISFMLQQQWCKNGIQNNC